MVASGRAARYSGTPSHNLNICFVPYTGLTISSPGFPATCPYITTVGATYLPSGAVAGKDPEVAVTRFGSGGGFSNIYPIPSYQSSAVNSYLTNSPPSYPSYSGNNNQNIGANGGIWNTAGRGYPDVSAVGDNIVIYNNLLPTISTEHLSLSFQPPVSIY